LLRCVSFLLLFPLASVILNLESIVCFVGGCFEQNSFDSVLIARSFNRCATTVVFVLLFLVACCYCTTFLDVFSSNKKYTVRSNSMRKFRRTHKSIFISKDEQYKCRKTDSFASFLSSSSTFAFAISICFILYNIYYLTAESFRYALLLVGVVVAGLVVISVEGIMLCAKTTVDVEETR